MGCVGSRRIPFPISGLTMANKIIRVTELLRWAGITKPIPKSAHIKKAMVRGSAVHRYSLALEDQLEQGDKKKANALLQTWPANLIPYGHAIMQFYSIYRPTYTQREQRITDEGIFLTGCPDRVGLVKGYRAVIDYKTGGEYKWHRLQVALYAILLERQGHITDIRMDVYLSKEGIYKQTIHKSNKDLLEAWSIIKAYGEQAND
tara:strand:- start:1105 stop:1716 length:612 start_codon:yes stop_codon:yes gene_type:complete